eukprot:ANDGO_00513.mRNA.1 hypothetical protein
MSRFLEWLSIPFAPGPAANQFGRAEITSLDEWLYSDLDRCVQRSAPGAVPLYFAPLSVLEFHSCFFDLSATGSLCNLFSSISSSLRTVVMASCQFQNLDKSEFALQRGAQMFPALERVNIVGCPQAAVLLRFSS